MKKLFLFFVLLGCLYLLNTHVYAHEAKVSAHNIYCVPNGELWINGVHQAVIENNTDSIQMYYYEFKICIENACSNPMDGYASLAPHTSTIRNGEPTVYFKCNGYPGTQWSMYLTTSITGETSAHKFIQGTVTVRNPS